MAAGRPQSGGGSDTVPVIELDLTDKKAVAYMIADNRLAEESGWERDLLKDILIDISSDPSDIVFTGFDASELLKILPPKEETDDIPIPPKDPVTKLGDIYQLGKHRLACGDSKDFGLVEKLMNGERASLMATDPPYGVAYGVETGSIENFNYNKMTNDDNDGPKLQAFLEEVFRTAYAFLNEDAAWYLWHAQMTQGFFAAAAAAADILIHRQIIWVKPSLVLGHGHYHWRHELCFYGWRKGHQARWFGDRKQTTVWEIGRENLKVHPTQKPVDVFKIPMELNTEINEICYDPFAGSGTQFIAAESMQRRCYGIELDPAYCDVIIKRFENFTGKKAERIHVE